MKLSFILALLAACGDAGGDSPEPGCTNAFYLDADGDGHGDPTVWATACSAPSGYTDTRDDCDDANAVVHPGADEICDGVDDDCNGSIDVDAVDASIWFVDRDFDGYGDDAGTSIRCDHPVGHVDVGGDCDDYDRTVNPEGVEVCDGTDDDCDELVDSLDDSLVDGTIWYFDADADHFGDPTNPVSACEHPVGTVDDDHDCDDADAMVHPDASEVCDAVDNDCDGLTDDEERGPVLGQTRFYVDSDGDGLGSGLRGSDQDACVAPEGWVANNDDCDDGDASVLGEVLWFYDDDGDGYGDDDWGVACAFPSSLVTTDGDCSDNDPDVYPTAVEVCDDLKDNNCDGTIDDDDPLVFWPTWYRDADDDGFGDDTDTLASCDQPSGYTARGGDCDDADSYVNPFAPEYCDTLDNDCDGSIDESVLYVDWYEDADGDGYGLTDEVVNDCVAPSGYGPLPGDCDDTVATTSPGEIETCDNDADDDCDGVPDNCVIDEIEFVITGFEDAYAGKAMAAADLNADGIADLVLGLPGDDYDESGGSILYGPLSGILSASATVTLFDDAETPDDLGYSLAAGDADGDGADDVILGAPDGYANADGVYLFFGPITASRTSADLVFTNGDSLDQLLGWNVELVSDADGDDAPDIVMGAPEAESLSGTADCGVVYVAPAAPGGTINLRDSTYIFVSNATARLGYATGNELDANGDGISDIAMSAPWAGDGAIYVVEGGSTAGVYTASTVAATTITPEIDDGFYPVDLVATDYDGDGRDDLIVGAPSPANGEVYVFLGPMSASLSVDDAQTTWVHEAVGAYLGQRVAADDLDGDGEVDVLMSANGLNDHLGAAYLQIGKASGTVTVMDLPMFPGPSDVSAPTFGYGMAVIPDWSGDGRPEVAIAAPYWGFDQEGQVYGYLSEAIF